MDQVIHFLITVFSNGGGRNTVFQMVLRISSGALTIASPAVSFSAASFICRSV